MSNKYQNGKIYKIVDNGYNKTYYGSTVETLSNRMSKHRAMYKYNQKQKHNYTVFSIFDEYGVENCKIELVELCPCNSKDELEKREGELIKANECVNKYIPKDPNQYEKELERCRNYKSEHKEELKEKNKEYYETNKAEIALKSKKYREENREKILERKKAYYYKMKALKDNK